MTNKFKDLKPYIVRTSENIAYTIPKLVKGKKRDKMISEMVELIKENKKIIDNLKSSSKPDGYLFG